MAALRFVDLDYVSRSLEDLLSHRHNDGPHNARSNSLFREAFPFFESDFDVFQESCHGAPNIYDEHTCYSVLERVMRRSEIAGCTGTDDYERFVGNLCRDMVNSGLYADNNVVQAASGIGVDDEWKSSHMLAEDEVFQRTGLLRCYMLPDEIDESVALGAFENLSLQNCSFNGGLVINHDAHDVNFSGSDLGAIDTSRYDHMSAYDRRSNVDFLDDSVLIMADVKGLRADGARINALVVNTDAFVEYDPNPHDKVRLSDCDFASASLNNCVINETILENSDFEHASMSNAGFISSELSHVHFTDRCHLERATFDDVSFGNDTRFDGANLSSSVFNWCSFDDSIILSCDMQRSEVSECNFKDTSFFGTDLSRAKFVGVTFDNVDFTSCNLDHTQFDSCTGLDTCNFTDIDISNAYVIDSYGWSHSLDAYLQGSVDEIDMIVDNAGFDSMSQSAQSVETVVVTMATPNDRIVEIDDDKDAEAPDVEDTDGSDFGD